jgi:hypothetical protein
MLVQDSRPDYGCPEWIPKHLRGRWRVHVAEQQDQKYMRKFERSLECKRCHQPLYRVLLKKYREVLEERALTSEEHTTKEAMEVLAMLLQHVVKFRVGSGVYREFLSRMIPHIALAKRLTGGYCTLSCKYNYI